jgi:hypothetical protein
VFFQGPCQVNASRFTLPRFFHPTTTVIFFPNPTPLQEFHHLALYLLHRRALRFFPHFTHFTAHVAHHHTSFGAYCSSPSTSTSHEHSQLQWYLIFGSCPPCLILIPELAQHFVPTFREKTPLTSARKHLSLPLQGTTFIRALFNCESPCKRISSWKSACG